MKFVCIIPSRYASTRLPGKPLCDIAGKPMVQRVYEQAAKASKLAAVVVAVDNPKVYDTVVTFGGHAVMTREDHANGTDRLAEAVGHFPDADVIVNVQGDEPLIAPDVIDDLCRAFEAEPDLTMATVAAPLQEDEYDDPSAVKVVLNQKDEAMYFRAPSSRTRATPLKKGASSPISTSVSMPIAGTSSCSTRPWNRRRQKKSSPWNSCGFSKMVIR